MTVPVLQFSTKLPPSFYLWYQQISQHPSPPPPWYSSFISEFHLPTLHSMNGAIESSQLLASARVIINQSANLYPNGLGKQHFSYTQGYKWFKWGHKWFASISPGLPVNGCKMKMKDGQLMVQFVFACMCVSICNLVVFRWFLWILPFFPSIRVASTLVCWNKASIRKEF